MANYVGETSARKLGLKYGGGFATVTALGALGASSRADGMSAIVTADNSSWIFVAASTAADTTSQLVVTPAAGSGRWLRVDKLVDLKIAVAFGTADAAVLFTVPTGFKLNVMRTFWEVTVAFTGGTNAAIGLSSSNAAYATKGDLQGGAGGDLLAALTAGYRPGTVGAKFATNGMVALIATNTLRFDRVVDAFTAGTGFAHLSVQLIG